MSKFRTQVQSFLKEEMGQDMVEYTILTGMIVVAIIASIGTVATYVTTQWTTLAAAL